MWSKMRIASSVCKFFAPSKSFIRFSLIEYPCYIFCSSYQIMARKEKIKRSKVTTDEDCSTSHSPSTSDSSDNQEEFKKPVDQESSDTNSVGRSENVIVVEQKTTIVNPKKRGRPKSILIKTCCQPSTIVSLVAELRSRNKNLNLKQIEEIGFSGLTTIKLSTFCHDMVKYLVDCFNPVGLLFVAVKGQKEFLITPRDCRDVFLLPHSTTKVPIHSIGKKSDGFIFVSQLKNTLGFDVHKDVTCSSFREKMLGLEDGDPLFKKMFVLYVCSTFLNPTANLTIDFSISKALMDDDNISKLDWCSYVIDCLSDAVAICKTKRKGREEEYRKRVGGCILLLQIIYFHRFMFRGVRAPTDLPLIQHWTNENFVERLKKEKESGFGTALVDMYTYPLSGEPMLGVNFSSMPSSSNSRLVSYVLPKDLLTDEEIKEKAAGDVNAEVFQLYRRDVELVYRIHMDRLYAMKECFKCSHGIDEESPPASQFVLTDHDIDAIEQSITQFKMMQELVNSVSIFDEPQHNGCKPESSNKVALDTIDEEMKEPLVDVEAKKDEFSKKTRATYIDDSVAPNFDLLNAVSEEEHIELDGDFLSLFSSFDCGPKNVEVNFASKFMSRNEHMMHGLPRLQQEVLDYCFFQGSGVDESEQMFLIGKVNAIFRFDILTLASNEMVSTPIVDGWCRILMERASKDEESDYRRFYFDLTYLWSFQKLVEDSDNSD